MSPITSVDMLTFSGCLSVCWQRACWLQADTWNCQQFCADPSQGFATRWRQFNGSSTSVVSLGRHTGKTGHCCTRWARFSRVLHAAKPTCPRVWMMNGRRPVSKKPSTRGTRWWWFEHMRFIVISCLTFSLSIFGCMTMGHSFCTDRYVKRLPCKQKK